ncbi:MAG: hypothetical protein ACLFNL_10905 [Bacteroidales bacterium]
MERTIKQSRKPQILGKMFFAVSMVVFISASVFGQKDEKAAEIIETTHEEYIESIEGVDDYILYTTNQTVYYKKAHDDGRPYFKVKVENKDPFMGGEDSKVTWDPFSNTYSSQTYSYVKKNAVHEGTEKIDGNKVDVIYAEDVEFHNPRGQESVEYVRLYIDTDKKVARKMEYPIETTKDGETREAIFTATYRDFREVEGMIIPYETVQIAKGLTLTEEERKEAEKSLEEFDKKMENLSESRREMVEKMMGDKISKYSKMIEEDEIKEVEKVKEVKVNTDMEDF